MNSCRITIGQEHGHMITLFDVVAEHGNTPMMHYFLWSWTAVDSVWPVNVPFPVTQSDIVKSWSFKNKIKHALSKLCSIWSFMNRSANQSIIRHPLRRSWRPADVRLPEPPAAWSASGPGLGVCSPAGGARWRPLWTAEGHTGWWSAHKTTLSW